MHLALTILGRPCARCDHRGLFQPYSSRGNHCTPTDKQLYISEVVGIAPSGIMVTLLFSFSDPIPAGAHRVWFHAIAYYSGTATNVLLNSSLPHALRRLRTPPLSQVARAPVAHLRPPPQEDRKLRFEGEQPPIRRTRSRMCGQAALERRVRVEARAQC
jgi:hypothetical protein